MKNWATLQADEVRLMNVHFTKGRSGNKINKVIIHHNAGNLTTKGCWDVWQTRPASAHYQVEESGKIGQLVYDSDMAWHAGNLAANRTSIGIEHADSVIGNNRDKNSWRISEKTLDNGAHLVASLCHYYKLGRPQWGKNLFGHSDFGSTDCPMVLSVGGAQHNEYVARAQRWYDAMAINDTVTTIVKETVGGIMSISNADAEKIAAAILNHKLGSSGPTVSIALQDGYWNGKKTLDLVKNLPSAVWAAGWPIGDGKIERAADRLALAANAGRK